MRRNEVQQPVFLDTSILLSARTSPAAAANPQSEIASQPPTLQSYAVFLAPRRSRLAPPLFPNPISDTMLRFPTAYLGRPCGRAGDGDRTATHWRAPANGSPRPPESSNPFLWLTAI
jgi:hypothetical protein